MSAINSHRRRSLPCIWWDSRCCCLLLLACRVFALSCQYICAIVVILFALSWVISVQQFMKFLRFRYSSIVLAMRHDNPTTVQWRMWGRWWAPRLNSFLAITLLYLSDLLSRLCDSQWSICCWFCWDGNVYYRAATHAPVLDRPAPLRRFYDSGAIYKYPDLLTYLTERGCQCWRCNCIVDWLELANQSAISYVSCNTVLWLLWTFYSGSIRNVRVMS